MSLAAVTKHECPATDCTEQVPFDLLACKTHWFAIPMNIRRQISRTWRKQNLQEWVGWRKLAVAYLTGQVKDA